MAGTEPLCWAVCRPRVFERDEWLLAASHRLVADMHATGHAYFGGHEGARRNTAMQATRAASPTAVSSATKSARGWSRSSGTTRASLTRAGHGVPCCAVAQVCNQQVWECGRMTAAQKGHPLSDPHCRAAMPGCLHSARGTKSSRRLRRRACSFENPAAAPPRAVSSFKRQHTSNTTSRSARQPATPATTKNPHDALPAVLLGAPHWHQNRSRTFRNLGTGHSQGIISCCALQICKTRIPASPVPL